MINMRAILLNFMPLPLVSYLAAMHMPLVLITYSTLSLYYLFAMDSDERSNMFVAADEKNSTKWVALLTEQHRNEMSI